MLPRTSPIHHLPTCLPTILLLALTYLPSTHALPQSQSQPPKDSISPINTTCTLPTNINTYTNTLPKLLYKQYIDHTGDFCTRLSDGKLVDRTEVYKDPIVVVSVSFGRGGGGGGGEGGGVGDCGKLTREDCLSGLRELGNSCRQTETFEFPSDSTTYLQGHSSLTTLCGVYSITLSPLSASTSLSNSNSTITQPPLAPAPPSSSSSAPTNSSAGSSPGGSESSTERKSNNNNNTPNLTDNSSENSFDPNVRDDGSGYTSGVAGAAGRLVGGGLLGCFGGADGGFGIVSVMAIGVAFGGWGVLW